MLELIFLLISANLTDLMDEYLNDTEDAIGIPDKPSKSITPWGTNNLGNNTGNSSDINWPVCGRFNIPSEPEYWCQSV